MVTTFIFDFDGVILDSNIVRTNGFRETLKEFPRNAVDQLVNYHEANGGLSRYHKFEHFYRNILQQAFDTSDIERLAGEFSAIMREQLTDRQNLIDDAVSFIKQYQDQFTFFVASGSDQAELRFLCKQLGIDHLFRSINGSPTPKKQIVKEQIAQFGLSTDTTILVGDATNDFDAANDNNLRFWAYNNEALRPIANRYIDSFAALNNDVLEINN